MITFEDFLKVELRVGKILEASNVEGSQKLVKLKVDIGSETRQIVAGIGKAYQPEKLIGKEIIIVANLEPKKLMGLESQGMLLAIDIKDKTILLKPAKKVPPGSKVS